MLAPDVMPLAGRQGGSEVREASRRCATLIDGAKGAVVMLAALVRGVLTESAELTILPAVLE